MFDYREGICFSQLEKDLLSLPKCHIRETPNLKDMWDGSGNDCECPTCQDVRTLCHNNVSEYGYLVEIIKDTTYKIRVKNEWLFCGQKEKKEFRDRELPYVVYFRDNYEQTDIYGYLIRFEGKVYDLIVHHQRGNSMVKDDDGIVSYDEGEWIPKRLAIVEEEEYYTTFTGEQRRVLKYVDYTESNEDYFRFDWVFYRLELEQMLSCKCCERHQVRKPSLVDFDRMFNGIYEPGDDQYIDYDMECACHCRSNARRYCYANEAKYTKLQNLILFAPFEIKVDSELVPSISKEQFYKMNLPYFKYDMDMDMDIKMDTRDDDLENCTMYYKFLVRFNDNIYDIEVCHKDELTLHKAVILDSPSNL